MWFNRPTTGRNYSGEQKVNFESPVPFSKCLRAKIYCNMNVHSDPQGCRTLLLKESEPLLLSLGSWTIFGYRNYCGEKDSRIYFIDISCYFGSKLP